MADLLGYKKLDLIIYNDITVVQKKKIPWVK